MIALYSINIRIMGGATFTLSDAPSLILPLKDFFSLFLSRIIARFLAETLVGAIFAAVIIAALYWFFGTETGSAIRATGDNEKMCRSLGINTDNTKIMTLMLSNALVATAGSLVAQQMSNADITLGTGSIVIGLAAVIIGETLISKKAPFYAKLAGLAIGSVIYYVIVAFILFIGLFQPSDTKILTALMVVIALSIPLIKAAAGKRNSKKAKAAVKKQSESAETAEVIPDTAVAAVNTAAAEVSTENSAADKKTAKARKGEKHA
jgi:putative ABC transport system permease protein